MDPFSITAGVITVVGFSGKVIAACSTYISTLKDAPNELFLIRAEVASLWDIVRTLDLPQGPGLPAAGNTASTQGLRAPNGTLARCEHSLKELLELLAAQVRGLPLGILAVIEAHRGSQNQKLYDDLGWSAFDLTSWPSKQKKAKALLGEIMQHKTTIILALEAESSALINCMLGKCRLAAPDVAKKHSSVVAGRFPGTCAWVFGHDSYVKWSTQGVVLWMNGIGNRIRQVDSRFEHHPTAAARTPGKQQQLAYFYFDKNKKDMTETLGLLRAVVAQLIQNGVVARESFQSAAPELLESVVTAIAATERAVIVLDAVDECEDIQTLLALVARLVRTKTVDILMSSRASIPIKKSWGQLTTAHPGACHELALAPSMNKADITVFVTQTVESMVSSGDLSFRDPTLRQEIIDTLKNRSDGMSQWAASHLRCIPAYCTDHDISQALKELPQGLDKTVFQKLLFAHRPLTLPELAIAISIEPESKDLDASSILTDPNSVLGLGGPLVVYQPKTNLVQFSHHTVREYLESLGEAAGIFHVVQTEAHAEIARTCLTYLQFTPVLERLRSMTYSDLQAGESGEGNLAFVHYAARYWRMGHAQQTTTIAGKDTLANLLYTFFFGSSQERTFRVWQTVFEPPWDAWEKGRQPAQVVAELAQRAAASAPMPMTPVTSALGNLIMARQRPAASATAPPHLQRHWERLPAIKFLPGAASGERRIAPLHAFHYLARINHPQCLSRVLSYGDRILETLAVSGGPLGATTLHEAAKHGAIEFLEVLFNVWKGSLDVNAAGMLSQTALFYESQSGSVGVVQLLLHHGADVTRADLYGSTPLQEAVIRGHHAVVECLLSESDTYLAVLNAPDLSDETPLAKACRFSDSEMARLLARHCSGHAILGAVRACSRWGTSPGVLTAIMQACSERTWAPGQAPVRQREALRGWGGHPVIPDRVHVLEALLGNGYPVDLEDLDKDTALTYALDDGQEAMSLALLDRGAHLSKAVRGDEPQRMGRAFIKAADRSGFKLALLLLERRAAWDVMDESGRGFVDMWAARVTSEMMREQYVRGNAPPDIIGYAATAGLATEDSLTTPGLRLLQAVLERGMDINATNAQGRSLLHLLCSSLRGWNGEGIPELLWILSHGADASVKDDQSMTPLHCLCENTQVRWSGE
ncbi:hypothetical protein VTJ49DRAFT_3624 [Mycothermus thermophilus]|uniref:Nephrocystin 3-like N-terminal domain-containing protein n=1 Tax=Humicola insolens TaxID=85995 RepID=A0ABR3V726_HUMIN